MLDGRLRDEKPLPVISGQNWVGVSDLSSSSSSSSSSRKQQQMVAEMMQAQQQRSLNNGIGTMDMRVYGGCPPQMGSWNSVVALNGNHFGPHPSHAAADPSGYFQAVEQIGWRSQQHQDYQHHQQQYNNEHGNHNHQQQQQMINLSLMTADDEPITSRSREWLFLEKKPTTKAEVDQESSTTNFLQLQGHRQQQQPSTMTTTTSTTAAAQARFLKSQEQSTHFVKMHDFGGKPDLKLLFPKHEQGVNPAMSSKGSRMVVKDEDGDDLLSLRPPNSNNHSELTNASSSSPESSSHTLTHKNGNKRSRIEEDKKFECGTSASGGGTGGDHPPGLQLVHILLKCAEAVDRGDMEGAIDLLGQLRQGASVYGDSMQRLAAHFSEGLAARLMLQQRSSSNNKLHEETAEIFKSLQESRRKSSSWSSSSSNCSKPEHHPQQQQQQQQHRRQQGSEEDEYQAAFTALYTVSPFFKLPHFTANQAIVEAVEGKEAVHVIDFDIMQGFQWPSLIQAMASRAGGPPALLRLTGIGPREDALRDTGNRLASFAANFGVPFRFHAVVASDLEGACLLEKIELRPGEAVAVNAVFQLHRLLNRTPEAMKLEAFLSALARIRPVVVTLVEQEATHNAPTFLARFMEALHYYAAVFDSLDASLPQRNEERVRIEQVMFAKQIQNIVSCEGAERVERHEKMGFWAGKMDEAGFQQLPLSSHAVSQAKLLLQLCPCDGYRVVESPADAWPVSSISLAWQERLLLTASAWACSSSPSSAF